ncbi:MAG: 16S rRNA (cytidine(1402)-2'-O)-methyltransferase [Bacillota bacterium]
MREPGRLYLCATPIGNLDDVSFRLLDTLRHVDLVAAEDTRVTAKLLTKYGIRKPAVSFNEHNARTRVTSLIQALLSGRDVALLSDAGTPGISDPGVQLVREAVQHGLRVTAIPGPTAFVVGLVLSGLDTRRFLFEGFLPKNRSERARRLEQLKDVPYTLVFYEAPHRLKETLESLLDVLGNRKAAMARELTKIHEEVVRGTLKEISDTVSPDIKGEITLVVEGAGPRSDTPVGQFAGIVASFVAEGVDRKTACRIISKAFGISSRALYNDSLERDALAKK